MPTVTCDGVRLHYYLHRDEAAQAPPLVLVHGAGGSLMHWPAALRRLPGHTVYSLDLPGHGGSSGPAPDSIAAYAGVVGRFAEALSLPRFVLAGHSMGGAVALEYALRYGECLAGLALVGAGARLRVSPQILEGIQTDFPTAARAIARYSYAGAVSPKLLELFVQRLAALPPAVVLGDFRACDAFDRTADLGRIHAPTLVLCGELDQMTPVKYSRYLAEHIEGAELVVIPGGGHMVMLEPQSSEAAVAAMRRFLARLPHLAA